MSEQYDSLRIANELRETASNMRLCLAEFMHEDDSLLAVVLKHFPSRIEDIAHVIAARPALPTPPDWPSPSATCETHYQTLLKRLTFWKQLQMNRGQSL